MGRQWEIALDSAFAGDVAFRVRAVSVAQLGVHFADQRVGEHHRAELAQLVRGCDDPH